LTPERWAQIRQIFDGALERSEVDRAAYLRVVCARDDELRREVESLLFLDSSFSLRLLRAYSKIKDQTVQRQLVSLMESIAANED